MNLYLFFGAVALPLVFCGCSADKAAPEQQQSESTVVDHLDSSGGETPQNAADIRRSEQEQMRISHGAHYVLAGHDKRVTCVLVNQDSSLIASGSEDGSVRVWRLSDREHVHSFQHPGTVTALAFNAEKGILASGCDDSVVRLWDPGDGQSLSTLDGHTQRVTSLDFHPHLPLLVSGSDDATVRIWDVVDRNAEHSQTLQFAHSGPDYKVTSAGVNAVAFSRNGELIAAGGWELRSHAQLGLVRLATLANREFSTTFFVNPPIVGQPVPATAVQSIGFAGSTLGTHVLIAAGDEQWNVGSKEFGIMCRWNLSDQELIHAANQPERITSVAIAGMLSSVNGDDNKIQIRNSVTGQKLCTFDTEGARATCIAYFGPDLVVGDESGALHYFGDIKMSGK